MSGHSRLRHSLRLSIEASSHSEFAQVKPYNNITPDSGSPGSTPGSLSTDSTASSIRSYTGSDWRICSVLCLHDYASDDPIHLSFSRNEILEIIQQEDSGWWAALRLPENQVGWISSAFVEPLSPEFAERLRKIPENLRILEYEAEQSSFTFTQVADSQDPNSRFPETLDNDGHLLPNIAKTPATPATREQFADAIEDASNDPTHLLSPLSSNSLYFNLSSQLASWSRLPWDAIQAQGRQLTPTTPNQRSRSLDEQISPTTISMILNQGPPVGDHHARSQSESVPHRHRRRRPLLLDDSSSLSRLSNLIESRDTASIDSLAQSPLDTMDAFSRLRSPSPGRSQSPEHGRLSDQAPAMLAGNSPRSPRPNSSWYMGPSYDDDEIKLDYDGSVRAATLWALVERLTLDYLKSSKEEKFRRTFLASFRTFASADVVCDLIVDRYHLKCPMNLTREEVDEWKEKRLKPTRHRVLTVFTMWMEDHNMVRQEPLVARRLQEFLASIPEGEPLALTAKLMLQALDRLMKIYNATPRLATPTHPASTPKRWRQKSATPDLVRTDITELARQLCLFEHRLYAKILFQDCWVWTESKNAVFDFCSTHDRLVAWVKRSLCNVDGSRKKADTFDFWITAADKCKSLHNISSMNAIVTALVSNVIKPTDSLWPHVHKKATLDALVSLRDSKNTFTEYKQLHVSFEGPCVPFVGMYLLEINEVHEDFPDMVYAYNGTPMINFSKRQKWAAIVEEMLRFQTKSYPFAEVPSVMGFIEANLHNSEQDPRPVHCRSREPLDGRALVEAVWTRK